MNPKIIYILTLIIHFNIIFTRNVKYEIFNFKKAVNYINNVPFKKNDYDDMISNLITLLTNKYVYLDIAKNPPPPYKPVDVIQELKSINTKFINYYEFYQKVFSILIKLQDLHVQIFFKKILELEYLSPIGYYIKTINYRNYVFCDLINLAGDFFDKSLIREINENKQFPIKKINRKDPFDYIQTFGRNQRLKSDHAQFTFNLNQFTNNGNLHTYPFIKEDLENIEIEFNNGNKINFDYKILKPKIISRQLDEFYKEEMKKYSPNDIIKPTIIEIEQKYKEKKNNLRKLQTFIWDANFQNKIKLKVDHKNKVNVIYQNSFSINGNNPTEQYKELFKFFMGMTLKLIGNKYPIVIIEDFNLGGQVDGVFFLLNTINPKLALNSLNIATKIEGDNVEYEIDNYGKGIKHKRSKIIKTSFNQYWKMFKSFSNYIRKPNEIIVFTDGLSFSATSILIKNLQESGNAIIVGYNGNPSIAKKDYKFDSSQSPTSLNDLLQNDINVINLQKYGIIVNGLSHIETFNDSYVNKEKTPIPREYIINPIDERSNIYNRYFDSRYDEFINEAKRIFKKYEKECNPNNKNMVLYNSYCKFGNDIQIGGYKCMNGRWHNTCQISNCKKPYIFDTYVKRCISEEGNKN